jgi:uncharacterized protein
MDASRDEGKDELVLEGIVVTRDSSGLPNIAPMGPRVQRDLSSFVLRPFRTAQTYRNLKETGCGVLQITDDVELLARAAAGSLDPAPELVSISGFDCPRLADTCRWYAFRVDSIDDSAERVSIECAVVMSGDVRPFFGFNRAKHAVLEAAILATRIGILPAEEIWREVERQAILVQKTAGRQEQRAFEFLRGFISEHLNIDT